MVAMGPIPPAVEKTKGEKDYCSISLTVSSYSLKFKLMLKNIIIIRIGKLYNSSKFHTHSFRKFCNGIYHY